MEIFVSGTAPTVSKAASKSASTGPGVQCVARDSAKRKPTSCAHNLTLNSDILTVALLHFESMSSEVGLAQCSLTISHAPWEMLVSASVLPLA